MRMQFANTLSRMPSLSTALLTPNVRFVWELDIPLDEGRARGVWPSLREGLHQYTPCNDRDVCGEPANISGVPGRGPEERVNAAPVVVGTGAWPGRITVRLGITSEGLATVSTQLTGRGGCAQRKWYNWIERSDGADTR